MRRRPSKVVISTPQVTLLSDFFNTPRMKTAKPRAQEKLNWNKKYQRDRRECKNESAGTTCEDNGPTDRTNRRTKGGAG